MIVAINGNRHQEGHLEAIDKLVSYFVAQGHRVILAEPFLHYLVDNLGDRFAMGLDSMPLTQHPAADIAFSIGGDGAFLKTARWIGPSCAPIAGINTGHLGYLSAFSFENPDDLRDMLIHSRYRVEERSLLQVDIELAQSDASAARSRSIPRTLTALNEIAITRGDIASMLRIAAVIDGSRSLNYMGDGLIISTPTGSTAYNLSVGGPILDPELQWWVLSPVAAHSLSMRPLVVKDTSVIRITVESRGEGYRLAADGKSWTLPLGAMLSVRKAPYMVRLIVQPEHTFTDTLRDKLGLGNTLV